MIECFTPPHIVIDMLYRIDNVFAMARIYSGRMVNHITAKICRDAKTWRSGQPRSNVAARWSTGECGKMLGWLEIGVKFIKTLGGQWNDR
jgi:hypothetical protein